MFLGFVDYCQLEGFVGEARHIVHAIAIEHFNHGLPKPFLPRYFGRDFP